MEFQLSKDHIQDLMKRPFFSKRALHVMSFMDQHDLWPSSGRVVVALSGGADSLFLTLVLKKALLAGRLQSITAVHFNHGNRRDQKQEAEFVGQFCRQLDIPLQVIELKMQEESNFESRARKARYGHLNNVSKAGDVIAVGQHIDDSFEWSLMQQFKTSSTDTALGIPVFNGNVIRPLMCKTAAQIRFALDELSVPFLLDPTNQSLDHERNYIRNVLIPLISKKYPSYLKNYVSRANKLAFDKGIHRLEGNTNQWKRFEDRFGGVGIFNLDPKATFVGGVDWLVDLVKELSLAERGSLRTQVEKMIEAQAKGKKGPMKFSGGVLGFMEKGLFYFIHMDNLSSIQDLDEKLSKELSGSEIPAGDEIWLENGWPKNSTFPFLFISPEKRATKYFGPGLKKGHFLFPKSTEVLLERGVYFQTYTRAMSYRRGLPLKDNVSFCFL